MKTIKVIIERNDNGNFQAVPQMNESIAFFGMGKTVAEAMDDLHNSYLEAKSLETNLPDMKFEFEFEADFGQVAFWQDDHDDMTFIRGRLL